MDFSSCTAAGCKVCGTRNEAVEIEPQPDTARQRSAWIAELAMARQDD